MSEKYIEVKTFKVIMFCPECKLGIMEYIGGPFFGKGFHHKCPKCATEEVYPLRYPRTIYKECH